MLIYNIISHYLAPRTPVVCANFIYEWRDLQFKIDSVQQIFENLFKAVLFTFRVLARNLLKEVAKEIFSYFRFDFWSGI